MHARRGTSAPLAQKEKGESFLSVWLHICSWCRDVDICSLGGTELIDGSQRVTKIFALHDPLWPQTCFWLEDCCRPRNGCTAGRRVHYSDQNLSVQPAEHTGVSDAEYQKEWVPISRSELMQLSANAAVPAHRDRMDSCISTQLKTPHHWPSATLSDSAAHGR